MSSSEDDVEYFDIADDYVVGAAFGNDPLLVHEMADPDADLDAVLNQAVGDLNAALPVQQANVQPPPPAGQVGDAAQQQQDQQPPPPGVEGGGQPQGVPLPQPPAPPQGAPPQGGPPAQVQAPPQGAPPPPAAAAGDAPPQPEAGPQGAGDVPPPAPQPGPAAAPAAAPAPIFIQLTPEQFTQLRGGNGPVRREAEAKLEKFDGSTPEAYRNFKARCDNARERNQWTQQVAKEMVFSSIIGEAASRTCHIKRGGDPDAVPPPPDAKTYDDFMTEIQQCFYHAEDSALAKAAFNNCRQRAGETLLQWHIRARVLFKEAYRNRDWETDRDLIEKFTHGLIDEVLATHVSDQQPDTFTRALTLAQAKIGRMAQIKIGRQASNRYASINAMGEYSPDDAYEYIPIENGMCAINDGRIPNATGRRANRELRERGPSNGQTWFQSRLDRDCPSCGLEHPLGEMCQREVAGMRFGRWRTRPRVRRGKPVAAKQQKPVKKNQPRAVQKVAGQRRPPATRTKRRTRNRTRGFNAIEDQRKEEEFPYSDEAIGALVNCLKGVSFADEQGNC